MKRFLLLFFLLPLSQVSIAQSEQSPNLFLWEIKGPELRTPSYLLGTMHLNDERLFAFSDSLYLALQSCEQFANEIDFTQFDSLLVHVMKAELSLEEEEETDTEASDQEEKQTSLFEELDPEGKPTFMDSYLFRAAHNLNKACFGLEDMGVYFEQEFDFNAVEEYAVGSSSYEEMLSIYSKGDSSDLASFMQHTESDFDSLYRMKERNIEQARSFVRLAKQASTFAAVGAGHLVGEANVLELLQEEGYKIRRVGRGKVTNAMDAAYAIPTKQTWHPIEAKKLGATIQSNLPIELVPYYESGELHISIEMDRGLVYASMILPVKSLTAVDILHWTKTDILPDTLALIESIDTNTSNLVVYNFKNNSTFSNFQARLSIHKQIFVLQMITGFSSSALESPHVQRYLDGLTVEDWPNADWQLQREANGAFEFLFPADIPIVEKKMTHSTFKERGEFSLRYKTFVDTLFGDEYLMRYNSLPSGITYPNPYNGHINMVKSLAAAYKSEVDEMQYFHSDQQLGADAVLVDSTGTTYYIRTLNRGSIMYVLVQKSSNGFRNDPFFESIKLLPVTYNEEQVFTYEPAKFRMKAPENIYHIQEEGSPFPTENFSFNMDGAGVTVDIDFKQYGKYQEINLSDSMFTEEKLIDETLIDSVLSFKNFRYEDTCPAYIVQYQNDSTYLFQSELHVYCNHHFISVTVIAPENLKGQGYVEQVLASFEFELDENSGTSLMRKKDMAILNDLGSKDSTTFHAALAAFNDYESFGLDHLPALCELLSTPLLDEQEEENAKFDIITQLHAYEQVSVEETLVDYYGETDNTSVKYRILESLSYRAAETSATHLLQVLDQTDTAQSLPESLYSMFKDSLGLLAQHYPRLKGNAERGVGTALVLEMLLEHLVADTVATFLTADSSWIKQQVFAEISAFKTGAKQDSSASIDSYLMDHLLLIDGGEEESAVYEYLLQLPSIYGKYRVLHNRLIQEEPSSSELLAEVMQNDYYRYWIMDTYNSIDKELPSTYRDKFEVAQVIMKQYFYENKDYWCDSCELVKELPADATQYGPMLLLRCDTEEEGQYFLGCVGPFDEAGHFDLDNNHSVYYTDPQSAPEPSTLMQTLIDYINDN